MTGRKMHLSFKAEDEFQILGMIMRHGCIYSAKLCGARQPMFVIDDLFVDIHVFMIQQGKSEARCSGSVYIAIGSNDCWYDAV